MSKKMTRRDFLHGAAGVAGAAAIGGCSLTERSAPPASSPAGPTPAAGGEAAGAAALPRRPFGRLGVTVPVLGMGTAAAGKHAPRAAAIALFEEAIDLGVNYMDTAPDFAGYGQAQSELGEVLARRREEVFLVTKTWEPTATGAERLLERNLEELRTDHADLVYAHSVGDDKMEPALVMGKGGVLEYLFSAREKGLIGAVGISGHSRPARFVDILREFPIDVVMCAVNFVDRHTYDFETRVLPAAAAKGCAIVAMKVFGGERGGPDCMLPPQHHELAFRYALSLPGLALAVVGMKSREELHQNLERVRRFTPLGEEERSGLVKTGRLLAEAWGPHFGPAS